MIGTGGDQAGHRRDRRPPVDRARLDAVFGDTLPGVTSDEERGPAEGFDEDFWRSQRPPHHG